MIKIRLVRGIALLWAASVVFPGIVQGDDLSPLSWRGQGASSVRIWEFSTGESKPALTLAHDSIFATGWYNTSPAVYGSKQGFWDIGRGTMSLVIPSLAGAVPGQNIQISFPPNATQVGSTFNTLVLDPPGPGAWYSELTTWTMSPNARQDTITITANTNGSVIDEVVVNLHAVPEPSAVALGAVGALFWLLRRKPTTRG